MSTIESGGNPEAKSISGLTLSDDWRRVLAPYSHIVLVANSTIVNVADIVREYPPTALFVFFNKVYKILDEPFEGNAVLVSRAQPNGANIVYRGEVGEVVSFFEKANFLGIMNIRLGQEEKLNSAADFNGEPTAHLDLVGLCQDFYTEGKLPTSGFAMALWLADLGIPASIVLAGFSARRSEKWRLVSVHDWNLEQTFLRTFARLGRIDLHGGIEQNAYKNLAKRFPEISAEDIALSAAEVLSERLADTNAEVDKLISLTNIIRAGDNFLRRLKPRMFKKRS
ncbi:3-deoxy-manno-octulosonate cytidylyltransferase [Neorhizobium sp. T786]|uniref:3-deoxy-manno-octulosonate cytidylyltransferase n=1 Tax=Pseudorhizobium xiangyangii TaxID=2883104 RepID=UPI001CFFFD1D|nr:3-deoxy-manno-octulosonate cytidylyltransferase [Neorhizobium xiangyangii]MCB5203099.1 3-deoxy-manno-octulosonate cytidylyltransferase [Neorhizobium xiangyangii]